jgi:hypothetical protein
MARQERREMRRDADHAVVLERQRVDGWDIAWTVILSFMCFLSLILLLSVVYDVTQYWREHKPSKSVGGGSDDVESGMRVSLDSHMTAVEPDMMVDVKEAKDEDIQGSLNRTGLGGKQPGGT